MYSTRVFPGKWHRVRPRLQKATFSVGLMIKNGLGDCGTQLVISQKAAVTPFVFLSNSYLIILFYVRGGVGRSSSVQMSTSLRPCTRIKIQGRTPRQSIKKQLKR